jgi:hypothetical protein
VDHDADASTPAITRWNSLYQTVDLVLTKFNEKVNFGANLFPNSRRRWSTPTRPVW